MEDIINQLQALVNKRKIIAPSNYPRAFKLYKQFLDHDVPTTAIVDQLMKTNAPFTCGFLTEFAKILSDCNKLQDFNNCFLTREYADVTAMSTRFFSVISFYSSWDENLSMSGTFFCDCLMLISKKSEFTVNICEKFAKYLSNENSEMSYGFLDFDYSKVDQSNLNVMGLFLEKLDEFKILDLSHQRVVNWCEKYQVRLTSKAGEFVLEKKSHSKDNEKTGTPSAVKTTTPESTVLKETNPQNSASLSSEETTPLVTSADKESSPSVPKESEKTTPTKETSEVKSPQAKTSVNYDADFATLVSEVRKAQQESKEAEKSLLSTITLAEKSMGQMSTSLSDSLGTIDFLKQENKSNEEKISLLKQEQSALENEKRDLEEKLRAMSQQLTDTTTEVNSLKKQVTVLKEELATEREDKQSLLDSQETQNVQVEEQSTKIIDLEQRLKKSLEQDAIAENQELITLKKELSRQLQDAFKDSLEYGRQDYSADLLESYQFLLNKIFKMFKRHGINFEEEG